MTLWPEEPAEASQPPQTRRQARENERTAARQASRRAGTSEATPGGVIPETSATPGVAPAADRRPADEAQPPAIPASAFAEPGVTSPSGAGSFDSLLFSVPQRTETDAASDASAFDLFRQAPDSSKPEPVTQPMAVVAAPPAAPAAPAPASADAADSTGERTLTRREMRAMMQAQAANQQANHAPAIADPVFPVTFTQDADAVAANPQAAPVAAPVSARQAEQAPDTDVSSSPTSVFTSFGAPATATPVSAAPAQPVQLESDDDDDDIASQERRPFTPPTGHWSTAAELEDVSEPITSRNVGHSTAATTTNALILPSLPQADATGPLTSTGEILVTGSIDLPRTLGATGAHDRIDSSDIDRLLDGEENEFNTSEVAPVRASRAISTHTSTRGVIAPPKKRGNTLPVVLMVTAGVLAVGVIGLLIAAYVLNVF
ncbi:hypothetical protein KNO15_01485 [Leifsonia shinshuensis]|uniref:hypothetical protein n=1 Tax=Leifsonia shinshuensis TaxID=150026 RepID=UPI001F50D43F|nr:hypothetical protein [Leifsonia shinshuensis]MCI0155369.1 hypothetical protein [Leifsonia shinshuensis]